MVVCFHESDEACSIFIVLCLLFYALYFPNLKAFWSLFLCNLANSSLLQPSSSKYSFLQQDSIKHTVGVLCGFEWTVTRSSFFELEWQLQQHLLLLSGKHFFCKHFGSFSLTFKTFQRNFRFLQNTSSIKTCVGLQNLSLKFKLHFGVCNATFHFPTVHKNILFSHTLNLFFFFVPWNIRIYSFEPVW